MSNETTAQGYSVGEIVSIRSGPYAGRVGRVCEVSIPESTVTVAVRTSKKYERIHLQPQEIGKLADPPIEDLVNCVAFSIAEVAACLKEIRCPPVGVPAFYFFENLRAIRNLIAFPFNLTTHEEKTSLEYAMYMSSVVATGHDLFDIPQLSEAEQKDIAAKEDELWEQIGGKEYWEKRYPQMGFKTFFQHLKDNETIERASRSLLSAVVLQGWGAFEILVSEIWTNALNSNPSFAHDSLATLTSRPAGQSPKQITVDDLAVFGFDLRDHMGTLLSDRFKFTGVEHIEKSYLAAFGKRSNSATRIKEILNKPKLRELEATRHLLAHKNGVVDKKFNYKAGLELPIGEKVPLDFAKARDLVGSAVDAGAELIRFVAEQLKPFESQARDAID